MFCLFFIVLLLINTFSTKSSWSSERVVKAEHVVRPKKGLGPFKHHGIKMTTNQGNEYLQHSVPKTGPVVTDAKHMSSKWTTQNEIPINGHKTVGGTLNSVGGTNYYATGTCIRCANRGSEYLKN